MQATVSSTGAIEIPARLREKYNIQPGTRISIVDYGGLLSIVPYSGNPIREGRGSLKGGTSMIDMLLEERAKERGRRDPDD